MPDPPHLLWRLGRSDEITQALLFLACKDSYVFAGAEPVVDGEVPQVSLIMNFTEHGDIAVGLAAKPPSALVRADMTVLKSSAIEESLEAGKLPRR